MCTLYHERKRGVSIRDLTERISLITMITLHELRTLGLEVQHVYVETNDSNVILVYAFNQQTLQPFYISTETTVSLSEFDTTNKKNYKVISVTLKKVWDNRVVHTVSLPNCYVFQKSLVTNHKPIVHQSNFMTPISSDPDDNVDWLYLLFHMNRYKKWFENMEMKPFMETSQHCTFLSSNGNIHMYEYILKTKSTDTIKCDLVVTESLLIRTLHTTDHYYSLFFDKQIDEINRKKECLHQCESYQHIEKNLSRIHALRSDLPNLRNIGHEISQHRYRNSVAFTNTKTRIVKNVLQIYRILLTSLSNMETNISCCYITQLQFKNTDKCLSQCVL